MFSLCLLDMCTMSGFCVILRTGLTIALISLLPFLFTIHLYFFYDSLEISCSKPNVKHGKILSGFGPNYKYKDSISFDCNKGFILKGSKVIHCGADNNWYPPPPICEISKYGP